MPQGVHPILQKEGDIFCMYILNRFSSLHVSTQEVPHGFNIVMQNPFAVESLDCCGSILLTDFYKENMQVNLIATISDSPSKDSS